MDLLGCRSPEPLRFGPWRGRASARRFAVVRDRFVGIGCSRRTPLCDMSLVPKKKTLTHRIWVGRPLFFVFVTFVFCICYLPKAIRLRWGSCFS